MNPITKPKVVLITNIPSPYRIPIFDRLASRFPGFTVIYCKRLEPDREWLVPELRHDAVFLDSATIALKGRFIHLGLNIAPKLLKLNPDIVITTQYYPACLIGFLYAEILGRRHVCMYDGWAGFDRHLSPMHHWLRALFYRFSDAFIGVSSHTRKLFESYRAISGNQYFWSPLCIDNSRFSGGPEVPKRYDIMLSGRIVEIKLPEFTAKVLSEVRKRRPGLKVLIVGSGDKLPWLQQQLQNDGVPFDCPGFIQQSELPSYYRQARLLLMPTTGDCWGLVANEAMAAGIPVITTPDAGAKDDLVKHGKNGYVLEPEAGIWVDHILRLLEDPSLYAAFSADAVTAVLPYTFDRAADGISEAIAYCRTLG